MRVNRQWRVKAALFVTSLLVTFLLVEVFLYFFTDLCKEDKKVFRDTKSGGMICYTSDPHHSFHITFIDPELHRRLYCVVNDPARKKAGYYPDREGQVALVGDSFAFGEGVANEETLAYFLDQKFPNINFRNFAESGNDVSSVYDSVSEILKSEKQIKNIIYFYNLNDVEISPEIDKRQHYVTDFENLCWERVGRNFFSRLLFKSTFFRLSMKAVVLRNETEMTIRNYLDMYFSPINAKELRESLEKLAGMDLLAKDHGVRFFVVIYPLLYKDAHGLYPFRAIHQLLESFCASHGIRCIDASHAFDPFPSMQNFTVHPIDYHPNRFANRCVVDYLMQKKALVFNE